LRLLSLASAVRRLALLAPLSLAACGTLIGLGDLEKAECSDACRDGRAEPIAPTSGSGSGEQVGGSPPTTLGGALGVAGTSAPSSGAGGTKNGGSSGGTNETPYVNGGAGSAAGTATEGSSGGVSDVGGGGTEGGGQSPSGGTQSGGGDTPNLPIRINFQLLGADVPTGYVPDTGLTFAAQDGLSFGWNVDHTDVTRDRGVNSSQLLDTLCQFHEGGVWELALPNGTYNVLVSVGDASLSSAYTLIVEGVTYWRGRVIGANQFVSNTSSITVADGRLTLSQGTAGELATRINFIEVSAP
jgi:hypothetical protein